MFKVHYGLMVFHTYCLYSLSLMGWRLLSYLVRPFEWSCHCIPACACCLNSKCSEEIFSLLPQDSQASRYIFVKRRRAVSFLLKVKFILLNFIWTQVLITTIFFQRKSNFSWNQRNINTQSTNLIIVENLFSLFILLELLESSLIHFFFSLIAITLNNTFFSVLQATLPSFFFRWNRWITVQTTLA